MPLPWRSSERLDSTAQVPLRSWRLLDRPVSARIRRAWSQRWSAGTSALHTRRRLVRTGATVSKLRGDLSSPHQKRRQLCDNTVKFYIQESLLYDKRRQEVANYVLNPLRNVICANWFDVFMKVQLETVYPM